jgi:ADP-ribose pyrophosphatase
MGEGRGSGSGERGGAGRVEPWERVSSEIVGDHEVFRVRRERSRSPRTGEVFSRYLLEAPDWVNVVAFTDDGRVILVEQYRHGAGVVTLEFPAGIVEGGEDPVAAGARELEEETGFRPGRCTALAATWPNAALSGNRLHVVRAVGCAPAAGSREQDPGEDLRVVLLEADEVWPLIEGGRIDHALTIAAWAVQERCGR